MAAHFPTCPLHPTHSVKSIEFIWNLFLATFTAIYMEEIVSLPLKNQLSVREEGKKKEAKLSFLFLFFP